MNLTNQVQGALQGLQIPTGWVGSALLLALISIAMVIALFYYLNRRIKRPYFALWSIAWIFYAIYLAAALGLQEIPDFHVLVLARRACIGISGLCMFWGSFQLTYQRRTLRELGLAIVLVVAWSVMATYGIRNPHWVTVPFFFLLGAAGVYTGRAYLTSRAGYHGGSILGTGFLLWGVHLFAFPLLEMSPQFMAVSYVISAVLAFMIAIGMIIEQEVNVAEKSYRVLFDSGSDAVFLVDLWTLKIIEGNGAAERLTKLPKTELIGRLFSDICPSVGESSGNVVTHQQMFNQIFRPYTEFYITQAGGSRATCEGEAALAEWHQRLVVQVNIRDVGERKKLGDQIHRAEKLSALGQLIAGVAHELNNPLAIVMATAQLVARRNGLDNALKGELDRIMHQSERAAKIVHDLLAYARPAEPQKTPMDLNRLVGDVLQSLSTQIEAAGIQIHRQLADKLPRTKADTLQVEQVFTNLLTNAIDALRDRPLPRHITISTSETMNTIRLSVKDNGPGMPPDIQLKIFDPFFTTKPLGRGTGLGLTISNTLVQEHRGKIWLASTVGKGTEFFVDLPLLPCEAEPLKIEQPEAEAPAPVPTSTGRHLLIIDDEPDIVNVLKCVLEETGYTIETANNGNQALQRLSNRNYDVILSDMRMPDLDGQALYVRIRDKYPTLARRVIFVTGDTVSEKTREFLQSTGNRWLSKPFHITDVINIVEDVLAPNLATEPQLN